jgi:hypothetical protein
MITTRITAMVAVLAIWVAGCSSDGSGTTDGGARDHGGVLDGATAVDAPPGDGQRPADGALGDGVAADGIVEPDAELVSAAHCRLPNADGLSCADGDPCTSNDVCSGGACRGTPKICRQTVAPECVEGTRWRVHDEGGICTDGLCEFAYQDTVCLRGCGGGSCDCPLPAWDHRSLAAPAYAARGPSMTMDAEGGVHFAWVRHAGDDSFADTSIRYRYRSPQGDWGGGLVADISTFRERGRTAVAVDPSGRPYVAYWVQPYHLVLAERSDAGDWSTTSVAGDWDVGSIGLAVDALGGVYLVYSTEVTGYPSYDRDLLLAYRAPGETTWASSTAVAEGPADGLSLEIDGAGGLHVAYRRSYDHVGYAHLPAGGLWSSSLIASQPTAPSSDIFGQSLGLDPTGAIHLSYGVLESGATGVRHQQRTAGGGWQGADLGQPAGVAEYGAAADDGAGGLHVVYRDAADNSLIYAFRSSVGDWTPAQIDTESGPMGQISLVVDAGGGLHVAYADAAGTGVRYAHRPAGGIWTAAPVDTKHASSDTALAIDGSGGVHLFYYGSDVLRLRETFRPAGGGSWTKTNITMRNATGSAAVAIDDNGDLHLAYTIAGRYVDYAHRPASGSWTTTDDVASTSDGILGFALDRAAGTVHLVARESSTTVSHTMGSPGGAWSSTTLEAEEPLSPVFAAVDGSGVLQVAFANAAGVRHLTRSVAGDWVRTTVGSTDLGHPTALQLDAVGQAVVIAFEPSALTLQRLTRASGGLWSPPVAVDLAYQGRETAVAGDAAGGVHLIGGNSYLYRPAGGSWVASQYAGQSAAPFGLGVDAAGGVHAAYAYAGAHYIYNPGCP